MKKGKTTSNNFKTVPENLISGIHIESFHKYVDSVLIPVCEVCTDSLLCKNENIAIT